MTSENYKKGMRAAISEHRGPVYDTLSELFVPLGYANKVGTLDVKALAVDAGYAYGAVYKAINQERLTARLARHLDALHRNKTGNDIRREMLTRHML
jgi:hypothetical protein